MKTIGLATLLLLFASTAVAQQSVYHSAYILNRSGRTIRLGHRAYPRPPGQNFLAVLASQNDPVAYEIVPPGRGLHLYWPTQAGANPPYVELVMNRQARQIQLNTHATPGLSFAHVLYIDRQFGLQPMNVDLITALRQDPSLQRAVSRALLRRVHQEQLQLQAPVFPQQFAPQFVPFGQQAPPFTPQLAPQTPFYDPAFGFYR